MGKHSTSLCAFKGRLRELLSAKTHKLALDTGEVRTIVALADFSKKFQEAEYSRSDLCTSMCSAFRSGKWKKERSDKGDHQALYMKINQCNDSIDGLRELVFDLCCDVYERIKSIPNVRRMKFYQDLYQIVGTRLHKENAVAKQWLSAIEARVEQYARAANRVLNPVDLTEDHVPTDSDPNSE